MPRRTVQVEIDEQTALGEVYIRSLMRAQLRLAIGVVVLIGATVGTLPLLFLVVPATRGAAVGGVPWPWLVLGVVVYPVLVATGWWYVRRAERNEQRFSDLVSRR